jgi:CRP/FNR family transcriptional regulator, cyclic AMP receptor protein
VGPPSFEKITKVTRGVTCSTLAEPVGSCSSNNNIVVAQLSKIGSGSNSTEEVLRRVQIFSGLDDAELRSLAARAVRKHYIAGQSIFLEGEPCAGLYVVAAGKIRIFKTSPNGREQILGMEGPGSSVAELPVFDGGSYPASTAAQTDCETLFVSRRDFQALCLEHPEVSLKVLKVVGGRLRRLVGIIEELSFTTVRQRLIGLLVRLAKEQNNRSGNTWQIEIGGSHQELANHIGTVRELVSRNLARLQAEGLIEMSGRRITIAKLSSLEAEQQGSE